MKRLLLAALICLASILAAAGAVSAQDSVMEGDITRAAGSLEIPRGTIVNGNVTVTVGEIVIYGTVNGNVTANMGKVAVHGDVNGNVEAQMGQVIITGNVSGSVRANMGEVIIDGAVGGDLYAALGDVTVRGIVGGSVDSGLGLLRIPGQVQGDVASKGKTVYITGSVEGEVTLTRGIVELGPDARVGGRIYVGRGLVKAGEGARAGSIEVTEELTEEEVERLFRGDYYYFRGINEIVDSVGGTVGEAIRRVRFIPGHYWRNFWRYEPFRSLFRWQNRLSAGLFNMLILFALAVLTSTLFPGHVRATGRMMILKTGPVIGWGLLAVLLAAPLAVFLAVTIIGIPLILVGALFLAAAYILGYTAIVQLIGEKVMPGGAPGKANPAAAIAVGVLIAGAAGLLPVLGWIISLALLITALGAALASRFGTL